MIFQVARHCPQHFLVSLWRRKSFLLGFVMVSSIFVVCLQFGSNGSNGHLVSNSLPNSQGQEGYPLGLIGHKTLIPRRNLSALNQRQDQNVYAGGEVNPGQLVAMNGKPPRYQNQINGDPNAINYVGAAPNVGQDQVQTYDNGHAVPNPPKWQDNEQQGQSWQYQQQNNVAANGNPSGSFFIPPLRVVHFDLKGAPLKLSYMKQIFPILKEAGANAILIEYEDMFPYTGPLAPVPAHNAYSKEDVKVILSLAKSHKFEVIPLVPTFGHLEFVLKLKEFRELREVDDFPQALCPSRNDSFTLIKNMIDQMVAMHPNIRWLHVGGDEVYHLGYCSRCMRLDRDNLFLGHVSRVARYVKEKHKLIPIVWDDMLRQMTTEKLKEFHLGQLVEPMVWTYVKDVYRFIPYNIWMTYSEVFPHIWAASAFKGAFGETLTAPNVKMHLENNEAWLEVMAEQHKKFSSFRGIAVTGWQRYDHLATLCELFPSGLPSLIVDLLTLQQGHFNQQIFSKFHQILQCTVHQRVPVDFETDPNLWQRASSCFFPGSAVFRLTQHHSETIKRVDEYLYDVTIHKAWLTDYNIRHNISSPMRVDEGLADYSSVYYPLTSLVRTARDALREVYDEFTVAEWIEQNIYPYIVKMEKLWKEATSLKKAKVWPKRPLPPLELLKKYSVGVLNEEKDDSAVAPNLK